MKPHITITFQYYRLLLLYNLAFSLLIVALCLFSNALNIFIFFLAKLLGVICAIILYQYYYNDSYFYFRNAGFNPNRLNLNAVLIDTVLSVFMIILYLITIWTHSL